MQKDNHIHNETQNGGRAWEELCKILVDTTIQTQPKIPKQDTPHTSQNIPTTPQPTHQITQKLHQNNWNLTLYVCIWFFNKVYRIHW